MKNQRRHKWVWRILCRILSGWLKRKFNFAPEPSKLDGPCLIIPNHVTAWDPLLVAMSFPKDQFYFVASEHIFRWGIVTKVIDWLLSPIPRRKGASGADTVMTCMRRIRKGASVCIFAEGDCTWDGCSGKIFSATGKLARSCGATLVTYRLEGGYLSRPRWADGVRRGKMRGYVVGMYSPEQLKTMTPEEINDLINRDIYEDAWQRQDEHKTVFAAKEPARCVTRMLYTCPACGAVGTLTDGRDTVRCGCGFSCRVTHDGGVEPPTPFKNIGEWDRWQRSRLPDLRQDGSAPLFSDTEFSLTEVFGDHGTKLLHTGQLVQYEDSLVCGEYRFDLACISGMSIHGSQTITFSSENRYYELKSKQRRNARKYLDYWQLFSRVFEASGIN